MRASLVAGSVAAALVVLAPFAEMDRTVASAVRAALRPDSPAVAAVGLEGEDAARVVALVERGGAAAVYSPTLDPLPAARQAPILRVTARALLDGETPAELLAGRVVVIDSPARAAARAADLAYVRAPFMPARGALALLVGLVALGAAVAVSRARIFLAAPAVLAVAGATLATGAVIPVLELVALVPLALLGRFVDDAGRNARLLAAVAAPLRRAAARAALPKQALAEQALVDLLGANGVAVLIPGAHGVRLASSHGLCDEDLRLAGVDSRKPPFRDASGVPRPADAAALLARPQRATLLPLVARARTEGWLLVTHEAGRLEEAADAAHEVCAALAAQLAAGRQAADALIIAAETLDRDDGTLATAAAGGRTGMALLSPAGATRWKNPGFDEALTGVPGGGDLGRVLALFRRAGESALATLERLLAGPARLVSPELGLIASVTPRGHALWVEAQALDAAALAALRRAPLGVSDSPPMVHAHAEGA